MHLSNCGDSIDSWPAWAHIEKGHIPKASVAAIIWHMMAAAAPLSETPPTGTAKVPEGCTNLLKRLDESLNRGVLLDNWNEPLDAYGKRIVRVILVEWERALAVASSPDGNEEGK